MAKKEGKKKSGVMGIVAIILIPLLILVLIGSFFYSIWDSIITLLSNLVGNFLRAVFDFIENPAEWITAKWAQLKNWLNDKGRRG